MWAPSLGASRWNLGAAAVVACGVACRGPDAPPPMPAPAPAGHTITAADLAAYAKGQGQERQRREVAVEVRFDPPPGPGLRLVFVAFGEVDPSAGVPPANAFPLDFVDAGPAVGPQWSGRVALLEGTHQLAVLSASKDPAPGDRKSAFVAVPSAGDADLSFVVGTDRVPDFRRPPSDRVVEGGAGGSLLVRPEAWTEQVQRVRLGLGEGLSMDAKRAVFVVGYDQRDTATGQPANGTHPSFVWRSAPIDGPWPVEIDLLWPTTRFMLVILDGNGNGQPDEGEPVGPVVEVAAPTATVFDYSVSQPLATRPDAPEGAPRAEGLPPNALNMPR